MFQPKIQTSTFALPKGPALSQQNIVVWSNGAAYFGDPATKGYDAVLLGFKDYDACLAGFASMKGWQMTIPGWKFTDGFVQTNWTREIGIMLARPDRALAFAQDMNERGAQNMPSVSLVYPMTMYTGIGYAMVASSKTKDYTNYFIDLTHLK